ncbi:MAG TPA: class I SAM-dependent methyltransferase [Mycobacteriales bacterium]|jgi:SAM-dependent methyltransferase|nr:class I SAM-dependent methyltransferase [Mycobacteriales bacterium]
MALPAPNHTDSSRFDLAEGVRSFNYRRVVTPLLEDFGRRAAEAGVQPTTKEEAGELYRSDPAYLFACGTQRAMQQLAWTTAVDSIERSAPEITAELKTTRDSSTHSRLELVADSDLPDWYTWHTREGFDDIHLVPGGYWRNELVGAVYERGGSVYRLAWRAGYDAKPGALEAFVRTAPRTDYERVIDLGCAFGGLTRVLRKVFPTAEVIGLDISAPALVYAHHLAEVGGQDITYSQRDAMATGYDDDSVDVVTAFLLLHEVPDDVRARILTEAFRILKPGGRVMFLDIPPYSALSPAQAFFESFDGRGNGENFWEEFLASDFPALLRSVGFEQIEDGPLDFPEPGYWGSSALWRTGRFDEVHRWVTSAVKPAAAAEQVQA